MEVRWRCERLQVRTLVERSRSVAIKGIEQSAEQVAEDGRPRTAGHQKEGDQGQHHPGVACVNTQTRSVCLVWVCFSTN